MLLRKHHFDVKSWSVSEVGGVLSRGDFSFENSHLGVKLAGKAYG